MICLDKDHSNFTYIYIDRRNNTHVPLFAKFLLSKEESQCTAKGRVSPIPYRCHKYLLNLIIAGIITIRALTCLQSVYYSHKEECTKQTLTGVLVSDYRSVIFFHKNYNNILKCYVTKIHTRKKKRVNGRRITNNICIKWC